MKTAQTLKERENKMNTLTEIGDLLIWLVLSGAVMIACLKACCWVYMADWSMLFGKDLSEYPDRLKKL